MNEPWIERWKAGRIGWHEPDGNASLHRHWETTDGRRVIVPLCGKTPDLLWLEERGNDVTGVELSEIAARAFFEENALGYTRRDGSLSVYEANDRRISIHCGDFFEFRETGFDACYDRGSLIALPADVRPAYARHLNYLTTPNSQRLLITLDYDDSIATGPPFSVSRDEVLSYWPSLELVDRFDDIANGPPKFRDAGLEEMFECVWC
jgi:thiopurine S-methyltransferase